MSQPIDPNHPCPLVEAVSRWTRRKDARPGEIIDAAMALFIEKGFSATKMEDIARRAGVTAGTLYRYFPGKEDMLKAAIRESMVAGIDEGEQQILAMEASASDKLTLLIRTWWQLAEGSALSGLCKLMLVEAGNFPELARFYREEVVNRGESLIAKVIEYGIATGEFRPQPIEMAVKVVVAPVVMAMLWKHTPGVCTLVDMDFDRYLDVVIATLLHGLDARPLSPAAAALLYPVTSEQGVQS